MAKNMTKTGLTYSFTMSLKGGDMDEEFDSIKTSIDFTDASPDQLMECCAGGSSGRVKLQAWARKQPITTIRTWTIEGLSVKFTDIIAGAGAKASYPDTIRALATHEDRVAQLMNDLGCDKKQADAYATKIVAGQ